MDKRIRQLNRYLRGWLGYFALADARKILQELDRWIRHRLRACVWTQWKRVRTRHRKLRAFGLPEKGVYMVANTRKGPWRAAMLLNNGRMQLVDSKTHFDTRHTGGRSIWGGGKEGRKGKFKFKD